MKLTLNLDLATPSPAIDPAGYIPLTDEDVQEVKAAAVAEYAALWLHNFPRLLEAVIISKNAHLLKIVSPTL